MLIINKESIQALIHLTWEVELLENAIRAVDKGNTAEAAAILDNYVAQ